MIDDGAQTNSGETFHSVDIHPAKRWAALVGLALTCTHDVPTVGAWAHEVGMCETQLRLRCRRAGVTAKRSLDFGRSLRAVLWREARGGAFEDYLDVADDRTIRRFLARVGLSGLDDATVMGYMGVQRVITDVKLIDELKRVLTSITVSPYNDRPRDRAAIGR